MRYGSLFSGIGGFDIGFDHAGMECAWQCEIDPKAREVLAKHWPNVERFEDVRTIGKHNLSPVDVICGGFPCQDVSIAGKRSGLAGERSGLWFEFARIIDELEPGYVVIENVPGLLSSQHGRDFAVILQWLVKRGYGVAWRVIDAQYFGVAQRRRRVFVVASFGNGSCAEILFEREGVSWNSPSRTKAGENIAFDARNGTETGDVGMTLQDGGHHGYSLNSSPLIAGALHSGFGGRDASDASNNHLINVPVAWQDQGGQRMDFGENISSTLRHQDHGHPPLIGVRRLTPTECERLQGFPDGWTFGSDSARYKQLGNAVAVPCAEWIGRSLMEVINV